MTDPRVHRAVSQTDLTVGRIGVHVARTQPQRVALYDERRKLTYSELDRRVHALACGLRLSGIRNADVVAAYLPNCIEYVEVVLAVSRAGAVFSPLNPRLKAWEIAQMLRVGRPAAVFTTADRGPIVEDAIATAGLDSTQIYIVDDGPLTPRTSPMGPLLERPPFELEPVAETDSFCLMFTSGTTGDAKGILATHRARMLWVLNAAIQYGLNDEDVYLGTMPQVHSAGLTFTLMHLYVGATVRILEHFDPANFLDIIERERITSSLSVPTMLTMVVQAQEQSARRHDLCSLRRLLTCGAPLPLATKRKVIENITDQLYDYYGSTESNSMTVLRPRDQLRKPHSVGQAFTNVLLMIAGPDEETLPPGETGEVWCSNPSVMSGYVDSPEETATVFNGRWYRTGDLGYLDDEGYLHLAGRVREVVISGGVNIYPAEIEKVLMMHPDVLDCAVVGVPDEKWGQAVKAYVVAKAGKALRLEELQSHCLQYLADYKKPRHLQLVPELPKNAGGKTVKRALPGYEEQRS